MSRTNSGREFFKIDFCKIVKFDCKCGRRYINTSNCRQCTDSYEEQTNADRIRSMTDEELAEFLAEQFCHGIGKELIKEWLEREVEE